MSVKFRREYGKGKSMKKKLQIGIVCAIVIMITVVLVLVLGPLFEKDGDPSHIHSYTTSVVTPTCTAQGYISHVCWCGHSYADTYVDALGHSFGDWMIIKEPTSALTGLKERVCECGEKETQTIDKLIESENLKYNSNGNSIIISGMGECTDTTVVIPNQINGVPVTEIAPNAFAGNNSIVNIIIPSSVVKIGRDAFSGCTALESITLYSSLTLIEKNAFYNCVNLRNVYYKGNVENWLNMKVEDIFATPMVYGANLYFNGELLKELTIPKSFSSIRKYAFYGCKSLISVDIPDTIISIGAQSFTGTGLRNVVIPNSVTALGYFCFASCYNLVRAVIPSSVTFAEWPFYNSSMVEVCCNADTSIFGVDIGGHLNSLFWTQDENETYLKYVGDFVFFHKENEIYLVNYFGNSSQITLPEYEGGKEYQLGAYAFFQSKRIIGIIIPSYVTDLMKYSLEINNLKSITFIDNIPDYEYSNKLESVTIVGNVKTIPYGAFQKCTSLKTVILPEGLEVISDHAFANCISLKNINIPNSVTTIDNCSFYSSGLTSIILPDSLTSVYSNAFSGCQQLQYNEYDNALYLGTADNPYYALIKAKSQDITSCEIHSNTKIIANAAFESCKYLTEITGGDSIEYINSCAFYYCLALETLNIPNSIKRIDSDAFKGCESLKYVEYDNAYYIGNNENPYLILLRAKDTNITSCELHSNTKIVYGRAFASCHLLESVTFNSTLSIIGYEAFAYCESLTSIEIPDSVVEIHSSCFVGCSSLTSIVLPDSLTAINDYTFSGCISLTSIVIPDSVKRIEYGAFSSCRKLERIEIGKGVEYIGKEVFSYCEALVSIEVDKDNQHYQSIDGNLYSKDGTKLVRYAVGKLDTSFVIPDHVAIIGEAFNGSKLTNIIIPDSVVAI